MTPQLKKDIAVLDAVRDQAHAKRLVRCARYKRVNARRAELIFAGQTKDNPEYNELRRIVSKIVGLAHPRPPLFLTEEMRALLRANGIDVDNV